MSNAYTPLGTSDGWWPGQGHKLKKESIAQKQVPHYFSLNVFDFNVSRSKCLQQFS